MLNAARSAAFICYPCIRPIAFDVGGDSNVLSISDSVIEDMTTFISNVSTLNFSYSGNSALIAAKVTCDGTLTIKQLLAGTGISCNVDREILHSSTPTDVTVVFAVQSGNKLNTENEELLTETPYEKFTVINSRHCIVNSFTYHKIDDSDGNETYDVTIDTIGDVSEEEVLKLAFNHLKQVASKMENNLA